MGSGAVVMASCHDHVAMVRELNHGVGLRARVNPRARSRAIASDCWIRCGVRQPLPHSPPKRRHRRRFERPDHARFITFSCYQRLPLLKNDAIKRVCVESLAASRERFALKLHGWVIMPEHVHMMIRIPDASVTMSDVLRFLKGGVARRVLMRWRELGAPILDRLCNASGDAHFWQRGGGYERNIFSRNEFEEKLNYMHMNPVKRGLVRTALDYGWSSARAYSGRDDALISIDRE